MSDYRITVDTSKGEDREQHSLDRPGGDRRTDLDSSAVAVGERAQRLATDSDTIETTEEQGVYQLPPEPPLGTRLWDRHGREWARDQAGRYGWTCGGYLNADWHRATWAGLMTEGPLTAAPPTTKEES